MPRANRSARRPTRSTSCWSTVFGVALTLICLGWVGHVPYYFGTAFYQEQFLACVLGLALALAYNALNWHGKPHASFSPIDLRARL